MYEKDGEKYFVVDGHLHFWDASPENWVQGDEEYAKGWIECFHDYQGLAPPETHWTLEQFQKYSVEDFENDLFEDGYVDKAIFQSTYLKEWYTNGFNDIEQNAVAARPLPRQAHPQRPLGPARGRGRAASARGRHEKYGIQGVKLYTAEWNNGSRGWRLTTTRRSRTSSMCLELGIKNIHVHKGPTIWPLDKDAFDVTDVDQVATDYHGSELHRRARRAAADRGLLLHGDAGAQRLRRPGGGRSAASSTPARSTSRKVMGELLFWVGEDKMLFGSDYAIWEPKWQVEGFVDWEMPDTRTFADYPRLGAEGKKKILGLNAAKLYGVEVPAEFQVAGAADEPAATDAELVGA